ncbi:hypothetical protein EMCRGX_G031753 [Ephydatia muelleri]
MKSSTEKTVHWFCALSESEPANTYLKVAMGNLAQTYESVEGHQIDTDDTLFIQSLQIIKASHNTPMGSPKTRVTAADGGHHHSICSTIRPVQSFHNSDNININHIIHRQHISRIARGGSEHTTCIGFTKLQHWRSH